ncbi:hint module domain-containing protein [Ditylenchus destructor]|uniref:Hint module domain-containing protein n=1 Tax=Ditylenchus destructor TaxID=166010 RepID=A0AAD4NC95_9BILA|nr:hint module domain-containing protein [Ditylenchus destructor]
MFYGPPLKGHTSAFSLLLLLNILHFAYLSLLNSCGKDSVPYLITVDLAGRPELHCETPSCFGRYKQPRIKTTTIAPVVEYDDNDDAQEDTSTNSNTLQWSRLQDEKPTKNNGGRRRLVRSAGRDFAECTGELSDAVCSAPDEWTGAVAEINNGTHISLQMECCRYDDLVVATELKSVVVRPGERYVGGVVKENGRTVAFDLVKEVRKNVTARNQVRYIVTIYRMLCMLDHRSKADIFFEQNRDPYIDRVTQLTSRTTYAPTSIPQFPQRSSSFIPTTSVTRVPKLPKYQRGEYESTARRRHPPTKASYYEGRHSVYGPSNRVGNRHQIYSRPYYPRRRQYYRPVVDDYEYYDEMPYHRPAYGRHPRIKITDDQLWPMIRYSPSGRDSKRMRPRLYAGGAYEPDNQQQVLQAEDEYQIPEGVAPQAPPPTEPQQLFATSDNNYVTAGNNYITLLPPTAIQPSLGVQSYVTSNYVPPPPVPPASSGGSYSSYPTATGGSYETYQQHNQQQQQQQVTIQTDCSSSCNSQSCSTPCTAQTCAPPCPTCAPTCTPTCTPACPTCTPSCCCGSSGSGGGGAGVGVFGALQCFSGDMLVKTPVGDKRIDDLQIGDMVLSVEQSLVAYSPIVMFLHKKPNEKALYLHVETESGRHLKLTEFHLIYTSKNCVAGDKLRLVHARDLKVGYCVYVLSNETENVSTLYSSRVTIIRQVNDFGIFSPLTASGDILVNGVLASCHSNMAAQTLQQTFFGWWRSIHSWTTKMSHMFHLRRPSFLPHIEMMHYIQNSVMPSEGELPFGVEYLVSVMEVFIPYSSIYS